MISTNRKRIIKKWDEHFITSNETSTFDVYIHNIPFKFITKNEDLISKMKDFFPISWQTKTYDPYIIRWKPFLENNYSTNEGPNCIFHNNFVSQRDFILKIQDEKNIQLIAEESISDGFFNFLRYFLPIKLIEFGKILFHSSCVIDQNNKAYLFFGPSGAGKTTIAQLCEKDGAKILGDDMNLLSIKNKRIIVEAATVGQRFFNQSLFTEAYPIERFFWIKKSNSVSSSNIINNRLGILLSSFANICWDNITDVHYNNIFYLLRNIQAKVKITELNFPKSQGVLSYVREL